MCLCVNVFIFQTCFYVCIREIVDDIIYYDKNTEI